MKLQRKIFSKTKGIISPITKSGRYKGGNKNLLNLAEDYLSKKQSKLDYLRKLGAQEIIRVGENHTSRSIVKQPVQVGEIIENFGKHSYKNGKRLIK